MRVEISKGKKRGYINYLEKDKTFEVSFANEATRKEIENYLTTKREFKIPESDRIDDFRVDNAIPTENLTYFELALCTLHADIGVWVHWEAES